MDWHPRQLCTSGRAKGTGGAWDCRRSCPSKLGLKACQGVMVVMCAHRVLW